MKTQRRYFTLAQDVPNPRANRGLKGWMSQPHWPTGTAFTLQTNAADAADPEWPRKVLYPPGAHGSISEGDPRFEALLPHLQEREQNTREKLENAGTSHAESVLCMLLERDPSMLDTLLAASAQAGALPLADTLALLRRHGY